MSPLPTLKKEAKILIGFERNAQGIERILSQEGVPFAELPESMKISPAQFSAAIVMSPISGDVLQNLLWYVCNGGALLTTIENAAMFDIAVSAFPAHISHIESHGKLFASTGKVWLECDGFCSNAATDGMVVQRNGKRCDAMLSKKFGSGCYIALPFDANAAVLDSRSAERGFAAQHMHRCSAEQVSLVSKTNVRQLVVNCLRELHFLRGLPYAHLWYYPSKFEGLFAFRVDLDEWWAKDCETTLALMQKHGIRATWALFAGHVLFNHAFVKKLMEAKQEVQSHGFVHDVFETVQKNADSIARAKRKIAEAGAHTDAFIAPFGKWNSALCSALADAKVKYSSEFSLDYDDFPFFVRCEGNAKGKMRSGKDTLLQNKKGVLQIPIHPMSIDRLRTRDFSSKQMANYFLAHFERLRSQQLPIIFYGHPTKRIGRYPEVFDAVFSEAQRHKKLWLCTMGEFAEWWKERAGIRLSLALRKGVLDANCRGMLSAKKLKGGQLSAKKASGRNPALRVMESHSSAAIVPMRNGRATAKLPLYTGQRCSIAPVRDTCTKITPIAMHRRVLHRVVMKTKRLIGKI